MAARLVTRLVDAVAAKGMASLLILAGNRLQTATGSWVAVFAVMIAFDWLAALLAIFCLQPLRARLRKGEPGA